MEEVLFYSIISLVIISLISLMGVFTLSIKQKFINKILLFIVAFAAGSLLATAFFDLIPESVEEGINLIYVLVGIIIFFVIEATIHWHHPHKEECPDCIKPAAYLNLIGDGLHNFLDGIIIVASFLISIPTGVVTTLSIALHEIPQEIGDFAVLIHSGFTRRKAIFFNFLTSLFAIIGGLISYYFLTAYQNFVTYIIAIAAGGFIYIATTDLFPELHKESDMKKIIIQFIALILGIILIWSIFSIFPE